MLKRARDVIATEGTEGRNPFEVLMLVLAVLSGASYAFNPEVPNDLTESHLPQWMVITWYILLCIGGLVGLAGVWQRRAILSLLVERAAMAFTGTGALIFAVIFLSNSSSEAKRAGVGVLLYALAALWRLLRIHVYLRKLREQLREAAA